jgi:hypothetical protein
MWIWGKMGDRMTGPMQRKSGRKEDGKILI